MRRARPIATTAAIALVVAACGGGGGQPPEDAGGGEVAVDLAGSLSPQEAGAAAASVNAFGFDLHRAVAEDGANTVTSPLSASVLLGMVAAGAGGTTADEMVEVLGLEGPRDTRYAALLADLTDEADVALSIANSLWAAQGYPFEDDYVGFVQETFGATLDEVDLGAPETADRIDGWVEEGTEGLITEIAEDLGLPDPQAVLVLLNAVYFQGTWTTTFDEDETRDAPFQLADGSRVEVPTMHRSDPEIETATGDGFTVARLPYGEDERFGMEVLLPDEDVALDGLLADLDADVWRQALDDLAPSTPEAGTEAAAVAGGVMRESAGPPPFVVDRPFAFTVSDRTTGTILFLGTVHDPRG